jgi:hypothetical protein
MACHLRLAGSRVEQGRKDVDGRRFPGSVGSKKAEKLPLGDGERHPVDSGHILKGFGQVLDPYGIHLDLLGIPYDTRFLRAPLPRPGLPVPENDKNSGFGVTF